MLSTTKKCDKLKVSHHINIWQREQGRTETIDLVGVTLTALENDMN